MQDLRVGNISFAVGYTTKDEDYLKFLFEGSADFSVVPSFAVIPAQAASTGMFTGGIPGLRVDPTKVFNNVFYFILLFYFILILPKRQILDSSKLEEFADDNFIFDGNGKKFS